MIPTFKEALKFWFKLGFISFGGPAGQIAIMHEFLVERKRWISESKFMHALNYCMLLPGPEAQQLATYIGWLLHRTKGGLAAGILFVLPSVFILLGLSILYVSYGNVPWIYAMFNGLKPAVIAIIIIALIKISKRSLLSSFHVFTAIAAFVCIFFFEVSFPLIILSAIILAIMVKFLFPAIFHNHQKMRSEGDESNLYSDSNSFNKGYKLIRVLRQIVIAGLFWLIPLIAFYFLTTDYKFWKDLSVFFTKAAFITFGGAYAVLPYVAQVSVQEFNWLSDLQMIDGLALGETTPGPLIMVLAFVGFMAGYNYFDQSVLMGTIGLLTTTYYTLLPCFLFIFAGAPIIERTQENKTIRLVLSIVTAAVVGVILNLAIYFGKAVVFPEGVAIEKLNYPALLWLIVSFIAMYLFNVGIIKWICISAGFGIISFLIKLQ